jgi:hypothetical protein
MSRRTKYEPPNAPIGADPDPDVAFARSVKELDDFCCRKRRRYGKWAPLVQWAAEQKIARDNETDSEKDKRT